MNTENEGQFTPGPWHQHGVYALSHEGMARGEAEANARLVAAAPEPYAACKTALEALRAWNELLGTPEMREATKRAYEYSPEIQALKAALAKADGL